MRLRRALIILTVSRPRIRRGMANGTLLRSDINHCICERFRKSYFHLIHSFTFGGAKLSVREVEKIHSSTKE